MLFFYYLCNRIFGTLIIIMQEMESISHSVKQEIGKFHRLDQMMFHDELYHLKIQKPYI